MSDNWYVRLALSALTSELATLSAAAAALARGDNAGARWWLDRAPNDARWARCALDRDLAAYAGLTLPH